MPFLVSSPRGIAGKGLGGAGTTFETAPDGNQYFAVLAPSLNFPRAMLSIERTYANLLRAGPAAAPLARRCLALIEQNRRAMLASGVLTAEFAEKRAKEVLDQRLLRPSTDNPQHLRDGIVARAILIRGDNVRLGAVGIGDISDLGRYPYWRAQEFGSTHLVGRELRGFFFGAGGQFPADPARRRMDPMFQVNSTGPKMTVRNPIEGKGFLTQATVEAVAFRSRLWAQAEARSDAQMVQIVAAMKKMAAGRRGPLTRLRRR